MEDIGFHRRFFKKIHRIRGASSTMGNPGGLFVTHRDTGNKDVVI